MPLPLPDSPYNDSLDFIAQRLLRRILDEPWPIGSTLPSERTLAELFAVSRPTLRVALKQLCTKGLLKVIPGSGYLVLDWQQSAGFDLVPHLLERPSREMARGFLELRRALAGEAIANACTRATQEDLRTLETIAEKQLDAVQKGKVEDLAEYALDEDKFELNAFAAEDLNFARNIVFAAKNPALSLFFNTVARTYEVLPELSAAMLRMPALVAQSYPAILALIHGGDGEAARSSVIAILKEIDEETLRLWEVDS
ncbi:MAG: FadR family transcriptional regulator [Deltaproteobacteria bacterium]|nr:FadR family transcriptional regulator [Deltaproteobacteria bacterium]